MTEDWTIPDDARIGRVALRVTDLGRMQEFYEEVIGLTTVSQDDGRAAMGVGEEALIILQEDTSGQPRQRDEAGLFHLAVRFPSRAALGDALTRVEDHWDLDGAGDHGVSEALYLTDPEGNGIELYHDRAREEWETTEDGMVEMETGPMDRDELRASATGADRAPDGTDIGHVHLETTDLDTARRFYADTLGLRIRQEMDTALFLAAGDYHHHVGLNTWNQRTAPATGRGLDHFELMVPDRDSLEALTRRCEDAGYQVRHDDTATIITGPDSISVRITVVDDGT